jgi:hypothetical protein
MVLEPGEQVVQHVRRRVCRRIGRRDDVEDDLAGQQIGVPSVMGGQQDGQQVVGDRLRSDPPGPLLGQYGGAPLQ